MMVESRVDVIKGVISETNGVCLELNHSHLILKTLFCTKQKQKKEEEIYAWGEWKRVLKNSELRRERVISLSPVFLFRAPTKSPTLFPIFHFHWNKAKTSAHSFCSLPLSLSISLNHILPYIN